MNMRMEPNELIFHFHPYGERLGEGQAEKI